MKITDIFPGLKHPDASHDSSNEKQQSLGAKILQSLVEPQQYAVLSAEWRRGLKDLQNAVLNPWNGVTQTHEEPGAIGTPTQAEITAERGNVFGYQGHLDDLASRGKGQCSPADHPKPEVTQPEIAHNQQEQERGGMGR
jgi:hypothetical protein